MTRPRASSFGTRLVVVVSTCAGVAVGLSYLRATTPQPGDHRDGCVVHVADSHQIQMQLQWVAGERITARVLQPPHVGRPKMT